MSDGMVSGSAGRLARSSSDFPTPVARSFGSAHNKKLEHKMDISTEELVSLIDETACMLRGICMDPAVPAHAKDAMQSRVEKLEAAVEKFA